MPDPKHCTIQALSPESQILKPGCVQSLVGRMSMAGHSAEILAVAWHAASAQILTTDTDGCVAVWRPSEGCIGHRFLHFVLNPKP